MLKCRYLFIICVLIFLMPACSAGLQTAPEGQIQGYNLDSINTTPVPDSLPRLTLPKDDLPHDYLTEWWYYTGHLTSQDGHRQYGFEFVIFQVDRKSFPKIYLAHFAITDLNRRSFSYDQRKQFGGNTNTTHRLNLALGSWTLEGLGGNYKIRADMKGYSIDLNLSTQKPPVLHGDDGVISFGPAGDSYYYSYTKLLVRGILIDRGVKYAVNGRAWMDHQWGNFLTNLGGGWDWFSLQLDNDTEYMIFVLRDNRGRWLGQFGTFIDKLGRKRELKSSDFSIRVTDYWTSSLTGAKYPSGWQIHIPGDNRQIRIKPLIKNQELNTEQTTGVTYWEGAVGVFEISGTGSTIGKGYVELTGYAD
ncbi:conserved hypothetical protein [Thermobaculum terrenum ATCC BAA-798]|uniref:AttH domain-containing protein n=1 Tax=Thermobaculum terrenum (strain ATCC BAA-798 / CCMEE 7001 / YNP1) TaxID=525904 RepID=D1CBD7_THET1|nr:lipocalin-like domain-containing protein [Thermobaculum terrenum]ACZ42102.1 conserved hypothetical protein [Thermobaculum terrenum ATCC BAA-798]